MSRWHASRPSGFRTGASRKVVGLPQHLQEPLESCRVVARTGRHGRLRRRHRLCALGPLDRFWTDRAVATTIGVHLLPRLDQGLQPLMADRSSRAPWTARSPATLLTAAGVAPRFVMKMLGRSRITVTMNIYAHVVQDTRREAVRHLDRMLKRRPESG